VPSKATQVEKRAIRESALSAGASVVKLIEEPIAAALGAGVAIDKPRGSMVIDIGGGTSEVAILSLNGIVYSESLKVGGDKFDEAIQTYVRRKFGVVIGESTAELIKLQVGCATLNCKKEFEPYEFRGRNLAEGIPELVVFQKEDGFKALENQTSAIVRSVRTALELSPPELAADISQDGIVITGGGALLHCLDTLIEQTTGIPARIAEDPLTCVARGGGIALGLIDKDFDLFAEE
jgi:rod shape-determining protein MreB